MMTLTMDNFSTLGTDDKVKFPPMFTSFDLPLIGRVKSRTPESITFVMAMSGVTLGTWTVTLDEGKFKWRT